MTAVRRQPDMLKGRLKSPEGTAPGREIPLIGVADVSLRGLGSPEEGEQKTFWSPSFFLCQPEISYLWNL